MTTSNLPVNKYALLLRKAEAAQLNGQTAELAALTAELNEGNPLSALPSAEFAALLDTILLCHVYVRGSVSTATGLFIRDGLAVLRGRMALATFQERHQRIFAWHQLAGLPLEPLVACCYMRLAQELMGAPRLVEA